MVAIVDSRDYEAVNSYNWFAQPGNWKRYKDGTDTSHYAVRNIWEDGKNRQQSMHRFIFELHNPTIPIGIQIDHISGSKLDNRLSNLRLATAAQNLVAGKRRKKKGSTYKGVFQHPDSSTFTAWGREYLGSYTSERDAARAYDIEARRLYGEFARLNLPGETFIPVRTETNRTECYNELGETFPSLWVAAKHYGVSLAGIWFAIKNGSTCKGLKWYKTKKEIEK